MASLESLLGRLIREDVEFVLIGGFAAVVHGGSLPTQDIDVCCRFSVDNLMRLQRALGDLHPVHRITPSHPPLELTPDQCCKFKNLYLTTDYGQLDCLSFVEGIGDYDRVYENSMAIHLPDGPCRVLTLNALIKAKEAMGRPRDREAVIQLKAIRERLHRDQ
ncbi:MAG: nucleotidyltransferase [Planctomycetota bacterium]